MTTFRGASRAVALLLMVEGAAGVAFGLWLTASLAGDAEIALFLEVEAPIWAAVVGAQVGATAVVPGALLAMGGRRWWRRPDAFDRSRREWIYGVLVLHLLALVLGAIASPPSITAIVVGAIGVAAPLGVLVAGATGRVDESASVKEPLPWLRLLLGAALVVLVVAAAAAVGAILTGDDDAEGPLDLATYPEDAVICRGAVTEACASRVALRAGLPVAWVPTRGETKGRVFVVLARDTPPPLDEGRVIQELSDGWVQLSVYTHPAATTSVGRTFVRQVTVGDVTADLYVEDDELASAEFEWTRHGVRYRISAYRMTDDQRSVIDAARRTLERVRYATP